MDVCRVCLAKRVYKDASELSNDVKERKDCEEIIMFTLNIELSSNPNISTKLCEVCYKKVVDYYEFKLVAQESNEFLHSLGNILDEDEVKIEPQDNFDAFDDVGANYMDLDCVKEEKPCEFETDKLGIDSKSFLGKDEKEDKKMDDDDGLPDFHEQVFESMKPVKMGRPRKDPNIKVEKFECTLCGNKVQNLARHMDVMHKDGRVVKKKRVRKPREGKECDICFKKVKDIHAHKNQMHNKSKLPYHCKPCGKHFRVKSLYESHVLQHETAKPFECDLCHKTFSTKINIDSHIRRMHLNEKRFMCNECGKGFFRKDKLTIHIWSHGNSKISNKKVCPKCGDAVKDLPAHMNTHLAADQRKMYPCKVCDKTFMSLSGRRVHMRYKHLGVKHKCKICGKRVQCIRVHMRQMHEATELPHLCSYCDRRFLYRAKLEEHERTHTGERPYACTMCDAKFAGKPNLSKHVRSVHNREKPNICEVCSKAFFSLYHLQKHMDSHVKVPKTHHCSECGKSYGDAYRLSQHMKTHNGERPFACELCDATFVFQSYLRVHMISHTRARPHPCRFCGVGFGRTDHRNRHEKTAHLKHSLDANRDD